MGVGPVVAGLSAAGDHGDDVRPGRLQEQGEEGLGGQDGAGGAGGEGVGHVLVGGGQQVGAVLVAGSVVDEHVQVVGTGGDRGREVPYGGGVAEIAGVGVDAVRVVALCADLLADAFGGFEGAGGEVDLGAPARETEGEGTPEVAAAWR